MHVASRAYEGVTSEKKGVIGKSGRCSALHLCLQPIQRLLSELLPRASAPGKADLPHERHDGNLEVVGWAGPHGWAVELLCGLQPRAGPASWLSTVIYEECARAAVIYGYLAEECARAAVICGYLRLST